MDVTLCGRTRRWFICRTGYQQSLVFSRWCSGRRLGYEMSVRIVSCHRRNSNELIADIRMTPTRQRWSHLPSKYQTGINVYFESALFCDITEMSVQNYHSTLRNIPEECRSNLHRGGGLKSRKEFCGYCFFIVTVKRIYFNFWCNSYKPNALHLPSPH